MTLQEFINHLKHNSIMLEIVNVFACTVGEYKHWIDRGYYDKLEIDEIRPTKNGFVIYLEVD